MKKPTKKQLLKILEEIMFFLFIGGCITISFLLFFGPIFQKLAYYEILVAGVVMLLISLSYELFTTKADKQ